VIRCADDYVNLAGVSIQPDDEARTWEPSSTEPFAPFHAIELFRPSEADFISDFKTELDELEVLGGVFH
jgi:hypothetical protein